MVNRDINLHERIKALRKEYKAGYQLTEDLINPNPIKQFSEWFEFATKAEIIEPNAMALATVGSDNAPSVRMLLMKEFSDKGFVFYTNYLSHKGKQLGENPKAALLFFWAELERQVRIEGMVEKLLRNESEAYFNSRPRGSQLGAAASEQSQVITSRSELEKKHQELDALHCDSSIPCPKDWGGYILKPEHFEFWQGQENRLHDRISYLKSNSNWTIKRLSP
jgi:pyridoxamine 5'-phosphate oxidase